MTAPSWIAMGDELRVELDALEARLWTFVVDFCGGNVRMSSHRVAHLDLERVHRRLLRRFEKWRHDRKRIGAWYAAALLKLRSHGRCIDWPDEPWRTG